MMGRDQDDVIVAPWTTIKYRVSDKSTAVASAAASSSDTSNQVNALSDLYPTDQVQLYPVPSASQQADTPLPVRFANVDQVLVSARSAEEVKHAIDQITSLLHQRHRIHDAEPDDFTIRDMTELIKALTSTTGLMTTLLPLGTESGHPAIEVRWSTRGVRHSDADLSSPEGAAFLSPG